MTSYNLARSARAAILKRLPNAEAACFGLGDWEIQSPVDSQTRTVLGHGASANEAWVNALKNFAVTSASNKTDSTKMETSAKSPLVKNNPNRTEGA